MKHSKGNEVGGIAFVGCIILGVGLGMLYGNISVGSLLGVGSGFILMAIIRAVMKS